MGQQQVEEKEWQSRPHIADRWPLSQYESQGCVELATEPTWSWKGRICMCKHADANKQSRNTHTWITPRHARSRTTLGPFSPALTSGALWLYWFAGQRKGRGWGIWLLLWGPVTQMDGPERICWQNIIDLSPLPFVEPHPCATGPRVE